MTTLAQVASWGSGGTPSRANPTFFTGSIPWVKTGELGPRVLLTTAEHISDIAIAESSAKMFPKGSVALAMYGATIGKASILGMPAATNQACAVGTPTSGLMTSAYLHHYVVSQRDEFVAAGQGGAQPNISQTVVKQWPIPLAPLAEQERIVAKLNTLVGRVDACRERLERVGPLIKRFRQSVLDTAANGSLTADWRAENAVTLDWVSAPLGSLLQELRNGLAAKPDEQPSGAPILRISAVRSLEIDASDHRRLTVGPAEIEQYALKRGDLIFTRYNGSLEFVGVCAMVTGNLDGYVYPDKLIRARVDPAKVLPDFVALVCASSAVRDQIEGFVKSSAGQKGISGADLKGLQLSIPTLQEQAVVCRRATRLLKHAELMHHRLDRAVELALRVAPATLAKAFRGELVPQDPNDEPADQLLARIRAERAAATTQTPPRKPGRPTKATTQQDTVTP